MQKYFLYVGVALALSANLLTASMAIAQSSPWPDIERCSQESTLDPVLVGWCLAIDETKGNCVACHTFNVTPWPATVPLAGNIAPPLVAMAARFTDPDQLIKQIEDSTQFNTNSTMPPYLRHRILTKEEIELIVEFLLKI